MRRATSGAGQGGGTTARIDRVGPRVRPAGRNAGTQRWDELLFVHWAYEPAEVRARVPAWAELDLWEGRSLVGAVPFSMRALRTAWMPRGLGLSFLETNLRTYVHVAGRPGVYFFSLEASSWLAVTAARRLWSLPYWHAKMSRVRAGDVVCDRTARRRSGGVGLTARYRVGPALGPSAPGSLEDFVLERYLLFCEHRGRAHVGQVSHVPYPVHAATIDALEQTLCEAAGLPAAGDPVCAHWSPGVDVEIFGPWPL